MERTRTKKKNDIKDSLEIPENAVINLSVFDWGEEKLTDKQKLFVAWFCTPGQEGYHCGLKAAKKAGYTQKMAQASAYKMRRDPKIEKLIKKFDDSIGKYNIIDAAQKWIQEKIIRGNYDVKDFYNTEEIITKSGESRKKLVLKSLDEMTPQQRLCIDGIDVKGQQGIMIYVLPDREKVRDSLITYIQKKDADKDDDGYDIETLTEIIKGEVKVKTRIINRNKEILEKAVGFHKISRTPIEEEE
jgi:hypothetical protein